LSFFICHVVINREHKELEMKTRDAFQTRVDGLQEQVRLLQHRFCTGCLCAATFYNSLGTAELLQM